MPPAIYPQNIIALIWDFDKTLTHDYMEEPLFDEFGVEADQFWSEVNELERYYSDDKLPGGPAKVAKDTIYLNHILTYVRVGKFEGLTNQKLRTLGAAIKLAPGLPDFFKRTRDIVKSEERFSKHDITVEHYIVSTGLRAMIQGSKLADSINGIWACDLLPKAPSLELQDSLPDQSSGVVEQVGYTIDNTSKTRAIFEINKGVNINSSIEVNTMIPEDQRRVPIQNMIYVADGPSDIPSFSLVNSKGGKTLGVYAPGDKNYENAAQLEEQRRVNSIAEADYSEGSAADKWLNRSIKKIAERIANTREQVLASYGGTPNHVI